jgi:omega-6 fatty acid desaturase (delta-12 desaturase)
VLSVETSPPATAQSRVGPSEQMRMLAPYMRADLARAIWQLGSTFAGFVACWYLALRSLDYSYALTLVFCVAGAAMTLRLFIVQHDCGHGSYFASRRANAVVGRALGVLTLTPFGYWRRLHALHHATSGNLDERGWGDIATLTVREYQSRTLWRRWRYRLYRSTFVLLVVGPAYQFFFKHRFPFTVPRTWKREWRGVFWTNLGIAAVVFAVVEAVGWRRFLAVQLPMSWIGSAVGIWLFYVQHQFEDVYWARDGKWDFETASLDGSSFLDIHPILHWCTGNIGYHDIHHIAPRIPNYRLRRCFSDNQAIWRARRLTLADGIRSLGLKLWDEERGRLVRFRDLAT